MVPSFAFIVSAQQTVQIAGINWIWIRRGSPFLVIMLGGGIYVPGGVLTTGIGQSAGSIAFFDALQISTATYLYSDPLWLLEATKWARERGYMRVFGLGYSAGSVALAHFVTYAPDALDGIALIALPPYQHAQPESVYKSPVLCIAGSRDQTAPVAVSEWFLNRVGSERKRLIVLEADHVGILVANPNPIGLAGEWFLIACVKKVLLGPF
ncbi:MAG: hypothetical protein QXN33_00165 [Candidatus Bathyarchaeia archaeon]